MHWQLATPTSHPQVCSKSHLINVTNSPLLLLSFRKFQVLESFEPRTVDEDQIYMRNIFCHLHDQICISYISHNIILPFLNTNLVDNEDIIFAPLYLSWIIVPPFSRNQVKLSSYSKVHTTIPSDYSLFLFPLQSFIS